MSPTPLRLLIVDDEPPARQRLRQLCAGIPDILVVGEAGNGREALEQAGLLAPEVVLLDVRMPGMDGLEAARARRIVAFDAFGAFPRDAVEGNADLVYSI